MLFFENLIRISSLLGKSSSTLTLAPNFSGPLDSGHFKF